MMKHRLIFKKGMAKEVESNVLEEVDNRPEKADSYARELHNLLNSA